jgi:hypothetical protein
MLREEHRLKVREGVLRIIFGSNRDEMIVGWRKCHTQNNTYSFQYTIMKIKSIRMRWASNIARMER